MMIDHQYMRSLPRDQDDCELGEFVTAYHTAYAKTQDHRQAFNQTAMWALSKKKLPFAFWTSAKIIANDLESHALLFPMPSGLGFIGLTIGGLSQLYDMNPVFDPQKGWPGWKRLDAESKRPARPPSHCLHRPPSFAFSAGDTHGNVSVST